MKRPIKIREAEQTCNSFNSYTLLNLRNYIEDLEKYCDELEQRCLSDEWELACLDKDCKKIEKQLMKALWALHEQMGDKGIYVSLGYEDLHFPSFEELKKWIEKQ